MIIYDKIRSIDYDLLKENPLIIMNYEISIACKINNLPNKYDRHNSDEILSLLKNKDM